MTPADCFAIAIGAGVALYGSYRLVSWLADRFIALVNDITRFE